MSRHCILSILSQSIWPFFLTLIGDLFILLHRGLSCHPFTHSIDIYSKTFSLRRSCHFIIVGSLSLDDLGCILFCDIGCFPFIYLAYVHKKK